MSAETFNACVVAAPGQSVDADGLIAFCREGLASFKRPRQVLAAGRAAQDRHREDTARRGA
jgi:hypothetical protein